MGLFKVRKILAILSAILISTQSWAVSLINDTETERLLTNLIKPLAYAAEIPDGRLDIHIINEDDFNAFVAGGEDVYVYTGLLKRIKNPNALQAVIAHEMGHMIGGHTAQMSQRMDAEMKRTMLIQALGVGLMVAGGNPSLGAGVLAGSSGIARQSMMAFTRDEERIADDLGVNLMTKANLNPNGFVTVFEQMQEITGAIEAKINPNQINHPLTTERLNNVQDKIKSTKKTYNTDKKITEKQNQEYEQVRAKLIGYLDTPTHVREIYPNTDKSDAALYARAISNMRVGNLDGALMGVQTLISRQPQNPYFYELMGDIKYQQGYYDDSVDAYQQSLTLVPNAPQIQTALALVLTERNKTSDKTQAIELCKRALLKEPAPLTYWVLARAYGDNDAGRRDWAMAEYYKMLNKNKDAKKFAKNAQKKLKKSDAEYLKAEDILKLK